jgi:UDP-N-acetylmuramoyl-L-alanyl-D-glutamate--2,6-diaminopimelate ligase
MELLPESVFAALSTNDQARARNLLVSKLVLDSRALQAGDTFIALQGGSVHGLQYLDAAIAAGANAIVFEADAGAVGPQESTIPCFAIPALRNYLGPMADRLNQHAAAKLCMLGVTGTNGKTTSVQLIAQALNLLAKPCAHIGTLGIGFGPTLVSGERTTPDVLQLHQSLRALMDQGAKALAMEVSSHALMQGRTDGVQFDVALFCNLTRDHLDYHGTMAEYFEAKARLFAPAKSKQAVVFIDDAYGAELKQRRPEALSFGESANADLRISHVSLSDQGASFTLYFKGQAQSIQTRLLGRFNVWNLTGVIGVLITLGHTLAELAKLTQQIKPVQGRMSPFGGGNQALVVVDYAHTPDALTQALKSLREHTLGQLICVFGCGGDRDTGKRPLMAQAVEQGADSVIVTSDNPRTENPEAIAQQICAGFKTLTPIIELDRARAIAMAIKRAAKGDVVLVAGKGHENYQEIGGQKFAFDDQIIVQQALMQVAA